jgi:molybdopterin converting factor subunit 1
LKLKIRYFASLREKLGLSATELECGDGITVGGLRRELAERHREPEAFAAALLVAVNYEPVGDAHALRDGDEVAFLPPMSGGSSRDGHFWLSETPIDGAMVAEKVRAPECGGIAIFVGTVRGESKGKQILRLEYEAYPGMAEKRMGEIGEAVGRRWAGARMAIAHRVGKLGVGEVAVAVAVATPHRAEAFEACRYAIDRLKEVVPIWKKEITVDGEYWVEPRA